MLTVIAARCPDGGSSPAAHWWAGLCGGRRTQGAVQRPARTGALADGSKGSAAKPGGSRPQGRHDQLGWVVSCWSGAAMAEVAGTQRPCRGIARVGIYLPVEALPEFTQAGQARASVQGFDVVDEFGDAG